MQRSGVEQHAVVDAALVTALDVRLEAGGELSEVVGLFEQLLEFAFLGAVRDGGKAQGRNLTAL